MAAKVHVVDLNAVEWLEGTSDLKSPAQVAVYDQTCLAIYARQGPVANDAEWIRAMTKMRTATQVRRVVDELISMGKLRLTDGGKLTNGRCERELERSRHRMRGLSSRRRPDVVEMSSRRSPEEANSAKINGLDPVHDGTTTTTTKNHTVTTTESDAARARNESGGGVSIELERLRRWRVPDELEARLQKRRPDITTAIMRERTREWRDYAAAQGVPRNFDRSWFGWQMATPRRHRVRSM
jgi:hypothetical protein